MADNKKAPRSESWLMPFSDMLLLLVVMFVLFLSFSEVDSESFRRNAGPIAEAFNQPPPTSILIGQSAIASLSTTNIASDQPDTEPGKAGKEKINLSVDSPRSKYIRDVNSVKLARHLKSVMEDEIRDDKVKMFVESDAVILRFPETSTFSSGRAKLHEAIQPTLTRIGDIIAGTPATDKVVVTGHTDNVPISTSRFRSNWDLSAARAVSVVHHLLKNEKIDKKRVVAVGSAESHPVAKNDTPKNRALNRRVEIRIEMSDNI
ncbi:MAG: OmpA family protein [Pseudomonadota bacterium]|nr:OmpA family protein [Pseudomonadota bacterium]